MSRSRTLASPMPKPLDAPPALPGPSSVTVSTSRPYSSRAEIVIVTGLRLAETPYLTEFSTSGWRIMPGTR